MKKISIIGLGFVGLPTFLVLSNIKKKKKYSYEVEGIEKDDAKGKKIKESFKKRKKWIKAKDKIYNNFFNLSAKRKSVYISNNFHKLSNSKIIIVSVNFDFSEQRKTPFKNLVELSKDIAKRIQKNTLLIFETTLPPGTTNNVILPIFKNIFKKRKMKLEDISFCYSYERVMPGKDYIKSIKSNYRCYSGLNSKSKRYCKSFFISFIDVKKFPLTEFNSIIECETAKILENSYRATNIALIDEWTRASKIMNINLKKIIEAIRLRKSHSNIMWPGLGVGGYCLTKDPSFVKFSMKKFFKRNIKFPIVDTSSLINKNMFKTSLSFILENIKTLNRKKVLICGITYREDTNDMRYSPAVDLLKAMKSKGAKVSIYDPFYTSSNNTDKLDFIDYFKTNFDIILFCVAHSEFKKISLKSLKNKVIFDLNRVLTDNQKNSINKKKNNSFYLDAK